MDDLQCLGALSHVLCASTTPTPAARARVRCAHSRQSALRRRTLAVHPCAQPLHHPLSPQFLRSVLLDVCGAPQSFSEYSLSPGAPADHVLALARLVRLLYADAVSRGTAEASFTARLAKLGVDAALVAALAGGLFCAERGALVGEARARVGEALGGRPLLSWDWAVSHVLGSSSVAVCGETLLRLTLVVGPGGSSGAAATETVVVELAPAEAAALLGQLEAAHAAAGAAAGEGAPPAA